MILSRNVTAFFVIAAALFFGNFAIAQTRDEGASAKYRLEAGTSIVARMENEISSKSSDVGDTFTAIVSEPISVGGLLILPKGTIVSGSITRVERSGAMRKNGVLHVTFDELKLPSGTTKRLDASLIDQPSIKASRNRGTLYLVAGTAIGALIGGLAKSSRRALIGAGVGGAIGSAAMLSQKGEDVSIDTKSDFRISLNKALTLPPEEY